MVCITAHDLTSCASKTRLLQSLSLRSCSMSTAVHALPHPLGEHLTLNWQLHCVLMCAVLSSHPLSVFNSGCVPTQGGVYRCHSIENISRGCPSASASREQKRKSAGRKNGYMSDSTLASSSLSKRVVQIRSSRGKRDTLAAKSQLSSTQLTSSQHGVPSGVSSTAYHAGQQHSATQRQRQQWFQSDSTTRAREMQSKYRTPTITEEPAVLRSISPPRASPMIPRSPATDYRVREPRSRLPRGYPVYPERAHSPDSSVVSGISGYSRDSSQASSVNLRDFALQSRGRPEFHHQRPVPCPPVVMAAPPPPPPNLCNGRTPAGEGRAPSNEQDPSWVVYGYV